MAKTDYTIENIYEPGPNKIFRSDEGPYLKSEDSPFLGKNALIPASQLGLTTDPRTANQLGALSTALNQGISVMEIGNLSPQTFETIPKQHFAEMRRKAKLAGAELTFHAPIQGTDPSGFGQQGYDESNRIAVERQLEDVIDKAIEIDDKGNMPITIHGSNAAGSNWKYAINEETGKREKVAEMLVYVDRESGQIRPIKEDIKYYADPQVDEKTGKVLGYGSKEKSSPQQQLEIHNQSVWRDTLRTVEFQRENAENALKNVHETVQKAIMEDKFQELNPNLPEYQSSMKNIRFADEHLHEASKIAQSEFSKAYKIATETKDKEQIEILDKISEQYSKDLGVEKGKELPDSYRFPFRKSQALGNLINNLRRIKTPEQFVPIENFSINKASETFSNVAFYAYEKKGEKAPALSIENLYQEMGFSQGDDLKNLVENSRNKFVEKLMKEKGVSKSKAEQVAAKLIGVTFDVGHLNMSKKFGYKDEDLVKEAEKVKHLVNKVHLTDNFGFNDSHLPPGMGNVPFQALLEALGEKGAKAIKINEVGGWFEHFKSSPFPQMLEAYGSPIYSSGTGPYWSQAAGFQQSYLEGYGQMLPQTNYQLFGAGFSQLPQNLGGQQGQQGGGRMGGGGF